jgi:hypothetical protein
MSKQPKISDVGLWWRWVLCTIGGFLLGNVFGIPASLFGLNVLGPLLISLRLYRQGMTASGGPVFGAILASSCVFGAAIGYSQWFVVRKLVRRSLVKQSLLWIPASAVGWAAVAIALSNLTYMPVSGLIGNLDGTFEENSVLMQLPALAIGTAWVAGSGLLIGILQWAVLRRSLPHAIWWIGVNVGLMLAAAIAVIPILRGQAVLLSLLLFFMGFLPIYAVITGAAIVKIRHNKQIRVD